MAALFGFVVFVGSRASIRLALLVAIGAWFFAFFRVYKDPEDVEAGGGLASSSSRVEVRGNGPPTSPRRGDRDWSGLVRIGSVGICLEL
jgi:hypothetical protein